MRLIVLIATFALALPAMVQDTTALAQEAAASENQEGQASSQGKVSGIDQSLFSQNRFTGAELYLYANQVWLDKTTIPGDKSDYGTFTILDDLTRQQVRVLIETAAETKSEKRVTGTEGW